MEVSQKWISSRLKNWIPSKIHLLDELY